MSPTPARSSVSRRRRPLGPAYGLLVGPFVGGVTVTLLVAAGTRQPLNVSWVLGALLVGATVATLSFAATLWRHEPHLVAGARARAASAAMDPVVPAAQVKEAVWAPDPGPAPGAVLPVVEAAPRRAADVHPDAEDPLAHIHAVEEQGRRLRRPCVNCGTPVRAEAAACPNCAQPQVYTCKGCQTPIRLDWSQCPECGRAVH